LVTEKKLSINNRLISKPKLSSLPRLPLAKRIACIFTNPSAITTDSIALANIILLVEEDQLGYFDQDGFAHDAWIALKEQS
jgi:hypothetical protein